MSDTKRLEQELEIKRQNLARSVSGLSDVIAPRNVAHQISETAQGYGGEVAGQVVQAARRNPAGLMLAGAGLALMATGTGSRPVAISRKTIATPPTEAFVGFDARVAKADAAMKKEMTGMTDETLRTNKMRDTLQAGLDKLPANARKRVLDARTSALKAQEKVEAYTTRQARAGKTFYSENPLAVGAIALGMGALIGALLPSTKREDELLGAHRDALAAKAEAALQEEMDKIHLRAEAKIDEVASA
ncbi:hypothetical protein [Phaeobacter italicus]|uniref:hypothetical protein n=1 Tax=Phaeobacter italicus TaxID=481446 RepID=UPI00232D6F2D|nr:hypothetical protein [Phaeobacter italicus]